MGPRQPGVCSQTSQCSQKLFPWLTALAGSSAWKGNAVGLFSDYEVLHMQLLDALSHLGRKAVDH